MIQFLPFDSKLFKYSVGSVIWESAFTENQLIDSAKEFQLVYIFSDVPISFLNDEIIYVDTKITFEKELKPITIPENIIFPSSQNKSAFSSKDLESIRFLALESGLFSRFKVDQRLSNNEFECLYTLWIDQAISSGEFLSGKNLEGIITFSQNAEVGKIGLVAVNNNYRQKGWGKKLVQAVEFLLYRNGAKILQIPTQESNVPAKSLYEKLGYQVVEKRFVYHYWRDKDKQIRPI